MIDLTVETEIERSVLKRQFTQQTTTLKEMLEGRRES